ncbi:MAG: hypothetical protein IT393_04905 [Nitrospirae bacterium]|nr:hypothetical protein [Nitrospirota bacterium]
MEKKGVLTLKPSQTDVWSGKGWLTPDKTAGIFKGNGSCSQGPHEGGWLQNEADRTGVI